MLTFGALLIAAALLTLATVAVVGRGADAPRWTSAAWAGELISIGLVTLFAIGLANFVAGFASAYESGPRAIDLGLLALVLVGAVLIGRRLVTVARLRASSAAPSSRPAAPPVSSSASEPPPRPTSRAA